MKNPFNWNVSLRKKNLFNAINIRILYIIDRHLVSRAKFLWRYRKDFLFSLQLRENFVTKIPQLILLKSADGIDNGWRVHATQYQTGSLANFLNFLQEIGLDKQNFSHFIDLGSGKGKMVFYAEKLNLARTCLGIEMDPVLYFESIKVKNRINSRCKFHRKDAMTFSLDLPADESNLIYMFNPFDDVVIRSFLKKNFGKLLETTFVYENDVHKQVFYELGFKNICSRGNTSAFHI